MKRDLLMFLSEEFCADAHSLQKIESDVFLEAYALEADQRRRVLRLYSGEFDFLKDRFAFQHVACEAIPIPEIVLL